MGLSTINHGTPPYLLTGLIATGNSLATGFVLLQSTFHEFTTVGSGTGATLPGATLPGEVSIYNAGANSLSVYPPAGGAINGGSAGAAATVAAGSGATYWASSPTNWYSVQTAGSGTGSGTVNSGSTGQVAYYAAGGTAVSGESIATLIGSGGISAGELASGAAATNVGSLGGDLEGTLPDPTVASIGGKAVTLAGALTTLGAHSLTFTTTANTSVTLPASGTLFSTAAVIAAQYGGTGVNAASAANGDLLIGNGSGFSLATLTAGTNVTITNASGAITIAASSGGGGSGTVNSGTSGQVAYYGSTGTAVSGESIATLIGAGGITTSLLATANVTYAKIQNVAATALLGNPTGSAAAPSEITLAANSGLVFSGTTLGTSSISVSAMLDAAFDNTQGDILYRGASAWTYLGAGTAGQPFVTGGASANPSFSSTGVKIDSHFGAITTDTETSNTVTVNLATSDWHKIVLTGNITTFTLSNPTVGQQFTIEFQQAASGGPYSITDWFTGTIVWFTSTYAAPTMPTTASGIMVCTFKCVSSGVYHAFWAGSSST